MIAMKRARKLWSGPKPLQGSTLAAEGCPRCGTAFSLYVLQEEVEEIPGHLATIHRSRRCRACGAQVLDIRITPGSVSASGSRTTRAPRL